MLYAQRDPFPDITFRFGLEAPPLAGLDFRISPLLLKSKGNFFQRCDFGATVFPAWECLGRCY